MGGPDVGGLPGGFWRPHQGNLADITRFTSSLSITESAPGQNKFDMRGLSTGGYAISDTSDRSLVAVYLDDTPISVQGQTPDLRIYDLDRVEVLRAPQHTLYGAGSTAGAIRFITAKPSSKSFFGTLEVTGAEHGSLSDSFRGMVNLPLVADKLALRATFYQGEDGGFIDNIGGRQKTHANLNFSTQARVALRWTPSDNLTVDFSNTHEKSRAYGLNQGFTGLAPYTISTNGPEATRDDFSFYALNWDYDLGFADLVSASSYTWPRVGYQASIEPTIGYFFADNWGSAPAPTAIPCSSRRPVMASTSPTSCHPNISRSPRKFRTICRRDGWSPRMASQSIGRSAHCMSTRRETCIRTSRHQASTLCPVRTFTPRTASYRRSKRPMTSTTPKRSTALSTPTTSILDCRTNPSTRLPSSPMTHGTSPAGSIKSRGVEFQSTLRLTPELTLTGSASYNDSRANGNIATAGAYQAGDRVTCARPRTTGLRLKVEF